MSTEGNKASAAATSKAPAVPEEGGEVQSSLHADEGIGVFRGLIFTALFYMAFGFLIWFAWTLFSQWRGH